MSPTAPAQTGREAQLLQTFVGLADTLVDDYDMVDVLHQLTVTCVELLGADAAGMLLADQRGSLEVIASSSEQTRLVELFQVQIDEGPCLDCFRTGKPVLIPDLPAAAERWPRFAAGAAQEGFGSVHAVPLRLRRETIGALNLFGRSPGALAEQDLQVARALASSATIGILQERAVRRSEVLTEQLQAALNSRIAIEQAKGILARAGDLDMGQAFDFLRLYSRRNRLRLSEVAHQLVLGTATAEAIIAASLKQS